MDGIFLSLTLPSVDALGGTLVLPKSPTVWDVLFCATWIRLPRLAFDVEGLDTVRAEATLRAIESIPLTIRMRPPSCWVIVFVRLRLQVQRLRLGGRTARVEVLLHCSGEDGSMPNSELPSCNPSGAVKRSKLQEELAPFVF